MGPRFKDNSVATIIDVAREAKVSIKTVSRVVNGEAGVHVDTRDRVQAAVQRLNYRPKLSARSLAGARSFLIALFYFDPQAAYAGSVQRGATRACRAAGYHLVVESLETEARDLGDQVQRSLATLRPDGVILTSPLCDDESVVAAIAESGTPMVHLSPRDEGRLHVRIDDRLAAEELTRLLIGMGHRAIGFLGGPADQIASERRQQGFEAALRDAQLTPACLAQGAFTFESGVQAAGKILTLIQRPTAVFCANDDMALGLLAAVEASGLHVPGDLSLVGFDDAPAATLVWPPLTTVRQPLEAMAETAVRLLLAQPGQAQSCVLPHEIQLRRSAAACQPIRPPN